MLTSVDIKNYWKFQDSVNIYDDRRWLAEKKINCVCYVMTSVNSQLGEMV